MDEVFVQEREKIAKAEKELNIAVGKFVRLYEEVSAESEELLSEIGKYKVANSSVLVD